MTRAQARVRALATLRLLVEQYPDMRIGQLIACATPARFNHDPFCVTDEALADELLALLAHLEGL